MWHTHVRSTGTAAACASVRAKLTCTVADGADMAAVCVCVGSSVHARCCGAQPKNPELVCKPKSSSRFLSLAFSFAVTDHSSRFRAVCFSAPQATMASAAALSAWDSIQKSPNMRVIGAYHFFIRVFFSFSSFVPNTETKVALDARIWFFAAFPDMRRSYERLFSICQS